MGRATLWLVISIFLTLGLVGIITSWIYKDFTLGRDVISYLKLTADAPTIERADMLLSKALTSINNRQLTSGNSAVIWRTPINDIGIWYSQITAVANTLKIALRNDSLGNRVSQLEKDNTLMKLREVLLDDGEAGTAVTHPANLSVYPNQAFYWVSVIILFIATSIAWIIFTVES